MVLERVRGRRPDVQIAFTYFSPSAEGFASSVPADVRDYLPIDRARDVRRVLNALQPAALVFSKLDVWPVLAAEAKAGGVSLGLVSGTIASGSSRLGPVGRALLGDAYAALDLAGAITPNDAERLRLLGVPPGRLRITGDARYDQVWSRARRVLPDSPLLAPLASSRPTLVAGSTWPSDERVLLPAWLAVRGTVPTARLIIATHEPTERHLAPIEQWGAEHGLILRRLTRIEHAASPDVVLVDRVGVLGELYALATCAYVGGAFHAAGLHSVLEPAAYGVPVLFGPRYGGSPDAAPLVSAGGAAAAASPDELSVHLTRWLSDPQERGRAGAHASRFVEAGLGAADRSCDLVLELLPPTA